MHPHDHLLDGEDAHFRDRGTEALASLDQLRGFFKLALREGALAQHHFAEAVLAVAAGGEDELAAVEEKLALDTAENKLELAGETSGIDFVEQGEKLVVRLDFAGVERERSALKPTGGSRNRIGARILGELLDETMEAGAIFRAHVHELDAHAVTGASVADEGARTDFAASDVEEQLDVRASGKRVRNEEKCSAYAQLLDIRDVALSGALPCDQQVFGRAVPRIAAAFVFWNFDGKSFVSRLVWSGAERKGWCLMTHP